MKPTVLHFIVCDRVRIDPENLHAIHIDGLKTAIYSKKDPPFPVVVPVLTVLAIFMGGSGQGEMNIRIVHAESGRTISDSGQPRLVKFVGNPDAVSGVKVFLPNCTFRQPGLYWVELGFAGEVIARQPIRVFE